MNWEVIQGDCLEAMRSIPDGSIDACITDPPYGTTACAWDSVIPFAPMWQELKRVAKRNRAIVLFGSQPFTSALIMSNPQMFKYQWVWKKNCGTNFQNAQRMPIRVTEDVCVFGGGAYFPQGLERVDKVRRNSGSTGGSVVRGTISGSAGKGGLRTAGSIYSQEFTNYPTNLLGYAVDDNRIHPTQKPVELMRYLVRTYTNAGETVLDFTCGSGTTGVACAIEGRNFIGIEKDPQYVGIARARIARANGIAVDIPRAVRAEKELPLFSEAVA